MYYYVYRISNKTSKIHYYGSRGSNKIPRNEIGISYFSSSKYVLKDIKKYGKESFKYKILKIFTTRKEAYLYEKFLHEKFRVVTSEKFYNKTVAYTNFGWIHGRKHSKETTDRIANKIKEINSKLSSKERSIKYGNHGCNNPFYGKKHSPEVIEKIKKANIGKIGPLNSFYGKKHKKESRIKISEFRRQTIEVEFYDGEIIVLKKIHDLGTLILKPSLGHKLFHRVDLWEKYNIFNIKVLKYANCLN